MHRKFSSFNLLPNVIQSSINEVLCKNVFDPFLNEKEESYVFGALSNNPQDSDKIEIEDSYYHLNQLQPIFKVNDSHYSFKDLLVELDKQGANLSSFKEWGDSSFLNFLPPINLDKFNNFQNYVWVDLDTSPSYVCMRSQLIHEQERMLMIARKMVKQPIQILSTTTSTIQFEGDCSFIFNIDSTISITDSTVNDGTYSVNPLLTTVSYNSTTNVYITTIHLTTSTLTPSSTDGNLNVSDVSGNILSSVYNVLRRVYNVTYFDTFSFDYDDPLIAGTDGLYYDQNGSVVNNPEDLYELNDWQLNNKWIHKEDVPPNMHGIPATQPIIEYQYNLEMNKWIKIDRQWKYKSTEFDEWIETTEHRPSVHEFNLSRSVANYEGLYESYNSFDISNTTLYVSSSVNVNVNDILNIKGNGNIYEVESVTTSSGQKAIKLRAPVTSVSITLPAPTSSGIDPSDKRFRLIGKKASVINCNEIMAHNSSSNCLYTMGDLLQRSSWAYVGTISTPITIVLATPTYITISGNYPVLHGNGAPPTITVSGSSAGLNGTYIVNNSETVVQQVGDSYTTTFHVTLPVPTSVTYGVVTFNYITNEIMQVYDSLNNENISLKILDIETTSKSSTDVLINQTPSRQITKIIYDPLYNNPSSQICGNFISFNYTSQGHKWLGPFTHWVYDGVVDLTYAANRTERPSSPYYTHSEVFAPNQEASIVSTYGSSNSDLRFVKNGLNTKVFIDDKLQKVGYVEGYFNGTTFNPNPSNGLCNGIKFDSPVSREGGMTVILDLSVESWSDSYVYTFGLFRTNTTDDSIRKYVSGVSYYKNYQQQYTGNEYPVFNLYDRVNNFVTANELFKYDDNGNYFSNELNDFVYKINNKEFRFENLMVNNGVILYYNNTNITKPVYGMSRNYASSVWRRTSYPAMYVPKIKDRDGNIDISLSTTNFWEIPPYVTNNPKNAVENSASNLDLYPHFKRIIDHNSENDFTYRGGYDTIDSNNDADRTYGETRYDVIGTITTSSVVAMLCANVALNKINFVNVMEFITHQQKLFIDANVNIIISKIIEDITTNIIPTNNTSYFSYIKQQHALNDLNVAMFGDSLTKRMNGIPNVCPTAAYAGLLNKRVPHVLFDHKRKVIRLQTHITQQLINVETECDLTDRLNNQILSILRAYRNMPSTPNVDDFWLDYSSQIIKQWDGAGWNDVISLDVMREIIGNNLVECEQALYDSCNAPTTNVLPVVTGPQSVDYNNIIKKQFIKYVERLNISDITVNPIFSEMDPFTWNYMSVNYANIVNPLTTSLSSSYIGCDYRFMYDRLFNTSYPHLEPWRMQGYVYKPTWWDAEYKWSIADGLPARRWKATMWNNILAGIVPNGQKLSDLATISTGAAGESTIYNFVSVNISNLTTSDGFGPDDLLPPYWIAPSANIADSTVQNYILIRNSAHINFSTISNSGEYGKGSYLERNWYDSLDFSNDVRVIARYLTQPLKYISEVLFNPDYLSGKFFSKKGQMESTDVCTLFTNNIQYDAASLFTYYARSKGILGINTNAGEQWVSSEVNYGHINDKLINDVEVMSFQSTPIQTTLVDNMRLVKRIDFTNFTISVVNQTRTSSRDQFKSRWKFLVNTNTNKVKSVDVKKTFFAVITKLNSNNTFNANLTDFTTGMTVTFAADGIISDDLSFQDIFYLIKISNSQGAIARTYADCMADVRVDIDDRPSGTHYIMVPNSTQPVNGVVIPKTQEVSTEITFPTTIVGEYSLINFLVGYIEKQHENGINEANTKLGVLDSTDVDWWSQINLLRDVLQKLNDFSYNGGEFIDAKNMVLNPYETEIRVNHGEQYIIDNFVNQNGEYEDDSQLYDVFGRSITSNDIMVLRGKQFSTIRSINGRQIGGGSINFLQKHSIVMLPEDYYKLSFGLLLPRVDEVQMRVSSVYNDRPGYVYIDGKITKNLSTTISTNNSNRREGTYNHYFNSMTDIDNISYSSFENNRIYETSLITKGTSQLFTSMLNGTVEEIVAFDMDGIINNNSNNIPIELVIDNSINSKNVTTISQFSTDADIKLNFSDSRQWPLLPHYANDLAKRWNRAPIKDTIFESTVISTNKLDVTRQLDKFYAVYSVEITQHNRTDWMYEVTFPINSNINVDVFIGKITAHAEQCSVMLNNSLVEFTTTYDSNGATIHVTLDDISKPNTVKVLVHSSLTLSDNFVSQTGYDDLTITEYVSLPYSIDVSYKIYGLRYVFNDAIVSMVYDTDAEETVVALPSYSDLSDKYMFSETDPSTINWNLSKVGKIWAKNISFKNWYNSTLYSNHEQQVKDANAIDVSKDWGIYRWVESDIPPEQWYDIHDARSLGLLTSETENTKQFVGEPYHLLYYRNRPTNIDPWSGWIQYSDVIVEFYSQDPVIVHPTTLEAGTLINVFINGSFVSVVVVNEFNNIEFVNVSSNGKNKITLKQSSPSYENTDILEFKRDFTYQTGQKVNDGVTFVKYYFWVKNHVDSSSDVLQSFENDIKPNRITYSCIGFDSSTNSFTEMILHNTTQRHGLLKVTENVEHTWDTVKNSNTIRVPFYLWNLVSRITKNVVTPYTLHDELISASTRYGLKVGQILCDYHELANIILDSITLEFSWGELTVNDIIDAIHEGTVGTIIANNYNTIPVSTINRIFFTLLFLCLSKTKFEYNVLITSLVDITTQVTIS